MTLTRAGAEGRFSAYLGYPRTGPPGSGAPGGAPRPGRAYCGGTRRHGLSEPSRPERIRLSR